MDKRGAIAIGAILREIALIGALSLSPVALAAPITVAGTFAFQGGRPVTDGYLRYEPIGSDPLDQRIAIWMTAHGASQPIKSYAIEMTKRLHVIIVDSSLSTFLHIHPTLGADGVFRIDQRLPAPGTYYLYADGLPNNGDHQVFRFVLRIVSAAIARPAALVPTGREITVGPYTIDLSKARLTAGGVDELEVGVYKGGVPAKDLHPYLGAPAHAVFLNARDLTYVHVHPMPEGVVTAGTDMKGMDMKGMDMKGMDMKGMDMKGMKMKGMEMPGMSPSAMAMDLPDSASLPATMLLYVAVREAGLYKMWLQFRGGGQLYVAPFVLRAE